MLREELLEKEVISVCDKLELCIRLSSKEKLKKIPLLYIRGGRESTRCHEFRDRLRLKPTVTSIIVILIFRAASRYSFQNAEEKNAEK